MYPMYIFLILCLKTKAHFIEPREAGRQCVLQSFMCVLVAESYPTLYHPMDCSLPVSSVHGILQAGILEWVAMPFSRQSS